MKRNNKDQPPVKVSIPSDPQTALRRFCPDATTFVGRNGRRVLLRGGMRYEGDTLEAVCYVAEIYFPPEFRTDKDDYYRTLNAEKVTDDSV